MWLELQKSTTDSQSCLTYPDNMNGRYLSLRGHSCLIGIIIKLNPNVPLKVFIYRNSGDGTGPLRVHKNIAIKKGKYVTGAPFFFVIIISISEAGKIVGGPCLTCPPPLLLG